MNVPQDRVIAFLSDAATHGGHPVERIDTHSAAVFLAGDRALKLKRAVRFDYLDFSTEPLRREACEAEVRINRLAAPAIYKGVVPVTQEANGALALGGTGTPVDWLVEMVRFDQDNLLDRLAGRDALDLALMPRLARTIADFHDVAPVRPDHGGRAGMAWIVDGNEEGFGHEGKDILDPSICAATIAATREELARVDDLLEARRTDGRVRQCHGDLHLRNIVLIDGQPTLFDAIEFNDKISCIDVLYDLAFLLMDLSRRGLNRHANSVFNAYLACSTDYAGLRLLPLFLSCRAAVRAKTSATAAGVQTDAGKTTELHDLAREYLDMSRRLLERAAPRLVAVGGLSGSGKSTLSMSLAPSLGAVPGALVLRSDEIRKSLSGVAPTDRLDPGSYTPEMSAKVYSALRDRAGVALRAGHTVIADAVWASAAEREAIEQVATTLGIPFAGLWLDAPADVLITRVANRGADASDADAAVVRRQLAQELGPLSWRRLSASADPEVVRAEAVVILADA